MNIKKRLKVRVDRWAKSDGGGKDWVICWVFGERSKGWIIKFDDDELGI